MSIRPGFFDKVDALRQPLGSGLLLKGLFALLGMVIPLLVAYEIDSQFSIPVIDFVVESHTGVIQQVDLGSSADVSGFWPGDVILSLDGVPFTPQQKFSLGVSQVEIQRGAERLTLELPVFPLIHYNAPALIGAVLVALVFWGASVWLLLRRFQRAEIRILFVAAQAIALALLAPMANLDARPHLWPIHLSVAGLYLAAPLILHLYISFPVWLGSPLRRFRVMGTLYGLAGVAICAWLAGGWVGRWLGTFYTVMVICAAFAVMAYVYARRSTPADRRRLRLVVLGTLLAGAPAVFFYLVPDVLGLPQRLPLWLVGPCTLVAPLCYLYAILRHNLFGIDRLLNRGLVYAILSGGIFLVYVGPLLWLYRQLAAGWLLQAALLAGLTLLVGISFDWTRTRIQQGVDRLFYGGWYDYPGVIETISDALARCLERGQLEAVLTRQVAAHMQLVPGRLGFGDRGDTLPLGEDLPALQFPLEFQGATRALWVVGPHRDGEDFSASDRRILKTLARQAEPALGNVLLVEALQRQLEELRASRAALTQAQRQLLRSREDERARLARDLHDGPLQVLVGLNMQLGLLQLVQQDPPAPGALSETLAEMRTEVQALLAGLRQVCVALRPPMLDLLGLGAALRALAEEWSAQNNLPLHLSLPADAGLRSLPEETAVNLYRVAQEALANVARHACASRAALRLAWHGHALELAVEDDGAGFSLPGAHELTAGGHFGLVGMSERVAAIGGELRVESAPGAGTRIRVTWPG